MSTEHGDEKTCYLYSPSAAGAGRSPRIVDISVVASALPRLEHLPWIDIFRGSGVCFDNIFWLLLHGLFFSFAFYFRVHVSFSTSTCQVFLRGFFLRRMCVHVHNTMTHSNKRNTNQPADWKMLTKKKFQQEEQSVQEELTTFPSSPAAFVSYLTPICHPGDSPVLQLDLPDHTELVHHTHAKAEISAFSQLTQASTSRSVHRKSLA